MTENIEDTNLAYLAGTIDGEGSIFIAYVRKGKYVTPTVDITNTCKEMIDFAANISHHLGIFHYCQRVCRSRPKYIRSQRIIHRITWKGYRSVTTLLKAILPYLVTKKEVARLVLEYSASRLSKPHKSPYDKYEEALVSEVRQLNAQRSGKRR